MKSDNSAYDYKKTFWFPFSEESAVEAVLSEDNKGKHEASGVPQSDLPNSQVKNPFEHLKTEVVKS